MSNSLLLIIFLSGTIVYLWCAVLILLKNIFSKNNFIFFVLTLLTAIWSYSSFYAVNTNNLLFLNKELILTNIITWLAILHFFSLFYPTKEKRVYKTEVVLLLGFIALLIGVVATNYYNLIYNSELYFSLANYIPILFLAILSQLTIIVFRLAKKINSANSFEYLQIKYSIFGLFLSVSFVSLLSIVLKYSNNKFCILLIPITLCFYILITGYSIIKYRFFSIRSVLRKILVYYLLTILVLSYLSLLLCLNNNNLVHLYSITFLILFFISTYFFIYIFIKIYIWLTSVFKYYIFPKLADYEKRINELSQKLNYHTDFSKITNLIIFTLQQAFNNDDIGIVIFDKKNKYYQTDRLVNFSKKFANNFLENSYLIKNLEKDRSILIKDEIKLKLKKYLNLKERKKLKMIWVEMKENQLAIIIPLISYDKLFGFIIMKDTNYRSYYYKELIDLLDFFALQSSIAITNALLYEKVSIFNKNLQEKVNEQTRDIKAKNVRLKKLYEMKSEFLAVSSHQLRTPLSIIRGMLSMVNNNDVKGKMKKDFILRAYNAASDLNRTVNDILASSDLETQNIEFKKDNINLNYILSEIVLDFRTRLLEKNIELDFKPPKEDIFIIGDNKVKDVFMNLLDNAICYSPNGSKIKITLLNEDDNVKVIIKDNGMGVTKKEKDNIFTKFYRGSDVKKQCPSGTGLGLFIVKQIVNAHNGTITLDSEGRNKGTAFTITFPK